MSRRTTVLPWCRSFLALAVFALAAPACGDEESAAPSGSVSSTRSAEGLPGQVAATRSAILAAAEAGDYGELRPVLDPEVFLSDFGFGNEPDPAARWEEQGPEPLETMRALLRMPHSVRHTNEGTLYQWPRFDADSTVEDLTLPERDLLLTFMSEEELQNAFLPELGYTGPRLGILGDGTWWFFILEGEA